MALVAIGLPFFLVGMETIAMFLQWHSSLHFLAAQLFAFWLASMIAFLLAAYIRWSVCYLSPRTLETGGPPSVQVLVLGDIGRSPRMQYHALSIVQNGGSVQLIGYHESSLLPELEDALSLPGDRVEVHALEPSPSSWNKDFPFVIAGPLKVLWQLEQLLKTLLVHAKPCKFMIIQNPPSIPTILVAIVVCYFRSTRLIIDWHNYGWSILASTRGSDHPFVRASKLYESLFGRFGWANLTVTHAMAAELTEWPYLITSPIYAMHDRPAAIFQPLGTTTSRSAVLQAIPETADFAASICAGKTRLLVSSTSWTPDEDFSLLLNALVESAGRVPPLLVIITGRGPQQAMYIERLAQLAKDGRLPNITVRTAFLSFNDYARLLAAADLGICLHMSSSGVDLPMKVVDMFGAGLPVLAYSAYASFGELVKEGENGCGFTTEQELTEGLVRLLDPRGRGKELARLKKGAVKEGARRWNEEWNEVVKPLFGFEEDK